MLLCVVENNGDAEGGCDSKIGKIEVEYIVSCVDGKARTVLGSDGEELYRVYIIVKLSCKRNGTSCGLNNLKHKFILRKLI